MTIDEILKLAAQATAEPDLCEDGPAFYCHRTGCGAHERFDPLDEEAAALCQRCTYEALDQLAAFVAEHAALIRAALAAKGGR